jgi:hypothetical protein
MKQTAVEWLIEQLNPDMKTMQGNILQDLLEQAKEMEKAQIMEAFEDGACSEYPFPFCKVKMGEYYYNETYEK